jgi:hypothetical protein
MLGGGESEENCASFIKPGNQLEKVVSCLVDHHEKVVEYLHFWLSTAGGEQTGSNSRSAAGVPQPYWS